MVIFDSVVLRNPPYVYLENKIKHVVDSCDRRTRPYKNGMTFDQCKDIAEAMNPNFKKQIEIKGKILWSDILEQVSYDELIYKLTLKYLRRDGYDIGDHKIPEVKNFTE